MENIRKYLGYVVFCAAVLAAFINIIMLFTVAGDAFKMIDSFGGFIRFGGYWLAPLAGFAVICVIGVLTVLKMAQIDVQKRDDRVSLIVGIAGLVVFVENFVTLVFAIKHGYAGDLGGKYWVVFIFSILIVAAYFVRRFVFNNNTFIAKIICAAMGLLMFIITVMNIGGDARDIVASIFWIIAFIGLTAHPLLSSQLK